MPSDGLFIIGSENFDRAMEIGLYPALAYLVLARGTQRDNRTTSWSAQSVKDHLGIRWAAGKAAIDELVVDGLVTELENHVSERPRYRLAEASGENIYLPNELIDRSESHTSPIRRVRECQSQDVLRLLIAFYQLQLLSEEHGVNRDWLWYETDVKHLMEMGPFSVWSARIKQIFVRFGSPLGQPWKEDKDKFWATLHMLEDIRLIEVVWYVADSAGELLYPLSEKVRDATEGYFDSVEPDSMIGWPGDWQFLTLRHQADPQLIGIYRVKYRVPNTGVTACWRAEFNRMEADFLRILKGL